MTLFDVAAAAALIAGVLLAFGDPLAAMVNMWDASPMYSYAYTVPVISAFLLWSRRAELRGTSLRPGRWSGALVMAFALTLLLLGQLGAIQIIQQIAFLIALVGIVLFLFGKDVLAVCAPSLGYLLFMIPLWDAFTEPLHQPFQDNSARLGVALLHSVGIPAHREGTVITLANITLEVARACSGVNYLVAVLALAIPMSVLWLRGWRRLALVAFALLIAGGANGLRVALIGALAYYEVGSPLHGPFHVLHGLFVAGIGYVALFAGLRLLQTDAPARFERPQERPLNPRPHWRIGEVTGLAVMFWTMALVSGLLRPSPVVLAQPSKLLPDTLGEWRTVPEAPSFRSPDTDTHAWSDAHAQLRRRYANANGRNVNVGIWYYEEQTQTQKVVNFRTADLHRIATPQDVALPTGGTFRANTARWPGRKELGLFWYDFEGTIETGEYAGKLRSLANVLIRGRSNGAAVLVTIEASADDRDATSALENFAGQVYLALGRYWAAGDPTHTTASNHR